MAGDHRIFLLDPGFDSQFGHHASLNLRFAAAFDQLEIFTDRKLDPTIQCPGAVLTRHFSRSLYSVGMRIYSGRERLSRRLMQALRGRDVFRVSQDFEHDLRAIWTKRDVSHRDVMIVHSEAPPFTRGLAEVLRSLPRHRRPELHIRFTNVEWVCCDTLGAYSALASSVPPHELNLYVEYDTLRDPVARSFPGARVDLMRGPIVPSTELPDRVERSRARNRPKILYFGALRRERGWYRLPAIAAGIRRCLDAELTVHAGVSSTHRLGKMAKVAEVLQSLGVRVIVNRLSEGEVSELFADHDLIILPYDADEYRLRGSSVALEAVLHACPLVVTQGTVMEDLTRAGNGRPASTDDEFVNMISEMVHSYEGVAQAATSEARRATEWRDIDMLAQRIMCA